MGALLKADVLAMEKGVTARPCALPSVLAKVQLAVGFWLDLPRLIEVS
jgi:hypothetical protein